MGKFYQITDFYPQLGVPTTTDKTIPESEENQHYNSQVAVTPDNAMSVVPKNWIMGAFGLFVVLIVTLHFMK